ncbi:MAG: PKD domain-containing protein [Bacteroidota bacterium]
MKRTSIILSLFLAVMMVAGLTSCKKPVPVADFTFTVDGLVATFTNASTDATTYVWDFGDGQTSTEASPVHTYADYGLYSVELTATGEGGEGTVTKDVELVFTPAMTMDGDFTKWSAIPDFVAGDGGTITKVKLNHDSKYLYVYVEGTAALRGFFDVYIDADNNTETGATTWIYPMGAGADYLLEGFIADVADADLFLDDPATTDWSWIPTIAAGSGFVHASALKTVTGGKAIEFSLMREMATQLGTTINIGFVDVAEDWSMQGGLPVIGGETSKLLQYIFD